ncbi:bifunctional UDP-N-acetylglucosamine diphosphorylase/glucosamine-1-phosphate N-acetyltransferase GlmU [Synergistaceae bacterium OttesenSCG-928-I11]|nr:bifunctional UDP-N-acetylglucosamine diphosphorylase/glucosamine-1-phosphate N-acetyltransferase GlmU [Synergistaceae bacterium OttesenSCG-928-I11]
MSVTSDSLGVLIMAAGKGTRMHSDKPKVLQSLLEEPVVYYILDSVRRAGLSNVAVLVGHRGEMVEAYVRQEWPDAEVVWQHEQLGTGHAVKVAEAWWKQFDHVLVLNGDVPLVEPQTLADLVKKHERYRPQCSLLSFNADDPAGYGRIVRLADGGVRIVEHKEAEEEELSIHEINAGIYLFETKALSSVVDQLSPNNEQNEYYITDAVHLIDETEGDVNVVVCEDEAELQGVNTPYDLAATARALNKRIIRAHMLNGLKCMDPGSTWIGPRAEFAPDVVVEPGVQIWGRSQIGNGSRIGAYTTLRNVAIGENTTVFGPSVLVDAEIGNGAEIGPFAFLRSGVLMKDGSRAGRFVEIKNSAIGVGAKVPHLSYIGDATIGDGTNIGAGTVTCNYDGSEKHRTTIGANCFVGSDTMFVAPVSMGDNASTAAGSVITKDVPDGALGIARARQTNIDDWQNRKGITAKKTQKDKES